MSLELIKFAFVSGELSPTFFGRSDLEKFDLGLAEAINFFVDYRGGLTSRPGTEFIDFIKHDDQTVKMFGFKYAPDIANTYVMLFGHNYVRFLQDGGYVLEAEKAIGAVTQANPPVVTVPAHGFSNGDWVKFTPVNGMVKLSNRTVEIYDITTDTFKIRQPNGLAIDASGYPAFSGAYLSRIYTVVSPYDATDIEKLGLHQYRDLVRITHEDFPPYELVRVGHANWTLTATVFGSSAEVPDGLVSVANVAGTSGVGFVVSSVNLEGEESLGSRMDIELATNNYSTTAGGILLGWNIKLNTRYYNVYRTAISEKEADFTLGSQIGYIGKAYGPQFVDNNIIPDFTKTPPIFLNPFADSVIEKIEMTAIGAGYPKNTTTVTITDPDGTGFVGYPIITDAGNIIGVVVVNGGSGYTAPVVVFTGAPGAAATATASTSTASGNFPRLSSIFQQRQIYASSINAPLTIWGSKPKQYDNFDISDVVLDNDSYEFELDSDEVAPIKHLVAVRGGMLAMTTGGVWLLNGGQNGAPITPSNVLAEPHTYTGISDVAPIKVDTDLIYVESKGHTVRLLSYNDFSGVYSGSDISILSNHLFSASNYITRWGFASDPFKLVFGRRLDGAMLMFTMVKEQNVYAWTRAYTRGYFEDVLPIQENDTDTVYTIVKRRIQDQWVQYVEKFAGRNFENIEESKCLDSHLSLGKTTPAAFAVMSPNTDPLFDPEIDWIVTASAAVFSAGDVGKVLRCAGAKATVTDYVSTTVLQVRIINPVTSFIPQTALATHAAEGEWSLDAKVGSVSGLWHLEGEEVGILLDGNVMPPQTVVDGEVEFSGAEGTRACVGQLFECRAQTLPLTVPQDTIEGRRKRVLGLAMRLYQSRGLKTGTSLEKLYEMRERTVESYGEPIRGITGIKSVLVQPRFDDNGQTYIVQDNPIPASILGLITDIEVGDDPQ